MEDFITVLVIGIVVSIIVTLIVATFSTRNSDKARSEESKNDNVDVTIDL